MAGKKYVIVSAQMPKKFAGENNKAADAKARKAAAKDAQTAEKKKQMEDKSWEDSDKQILKKQQKKEELERKKQEQLQKKAEAKVLLEEELNSIKVPTKTQPAPKLTRAQIVAEAERRKAVASGVPGKISTAPPTHVEIPIEENLNRLNVDVEVARNIDEAISVLSSKEVEVDKNPEKRLKAAFTTFEETNMPRIKQENPTLRLSQLKQILRKEWQKSPENPLVQRLLNQ